MPLLSAAGPRAVRPRVSARNLLSSGWRLALITGIVGAALIHGVQLTKTPSGLELFDFRGGLYNAGTAILHGHNPYDAGYLAHQAAIMRAGGIAVGETVDHAFSIPLYPAPANLAVVPFSLLPYWLAGSLFTLLSIGALVLGLRWLGVRDWRCFAVALVSWPSLFALDVGAVGPLLLLGVAAAWRWREAVWRPAIAVAAIVVAKLFPWPFAVWLLVTRRFRAFALCALLGAAVTLGAWAVIGFAGMSHYTQMLSNATYIQEGRAVSLVALLIALGIPAGTAHVAAIAAAAGLLGMAWRFARLQGGGGEARAFGLTLMAALVASPIVWEHYMVLLFVPIALLSPTFSPIWFLPSCTPLLLVTLTAVFPTAPAVGASDPQGLRTTVVWVIIQALMTVWLCRPVRGAGVGRSAVPARRELRKSLLH